MGQSERSQLSLFGGRSDEGHEDARSVVGFARWQDASAQALGPSSLTDRRQGRARSLDEVPHGAVMRVAIYGRKSTQDDENVQVQLTLCRDFAASKGWAVVQEFSDDGISGREFVHRPGFTAMLAGAKAKPSAFDAVVMRDEERFGRDQIRASYEMLRLTESGCRLFFYKTGEQVTLDSPTSKLIQGVKNFSAEDFAVKISYNTRENLHVMASKGWVTGTRTYGFDHLDVDAAGNPVLRDRRDHVE